MKNNKSKLPAKLWYVDLKQNLSEILTKGIFNYRGKPNFIHDLTFSVEYAEYSTSDYKAFDRVGIKDLEYVLIEIDTSKLDFKVRKNHREGIVYSQSLCDIDKYYISPALIKGYEIKKINLESLIYANSLIVQEAISTELAIKKKDSVNGNNQKIESINNRILSNRRNAWYYNHKLICFLHGEFDHSCLDDIKFDEETIGVD